MIWKNDKVKTLKWNEFFEVKPNKMKTFRIVPHLNMSNAQNRHLWGALHKAYELYHSIQSRLEWVQKDGIKVTFRPKDYIWFDMILKNTKKEGKRVEFYFSTSETMASKMKGILENKWNVTVEDANISHIQVDEKNTDIYEMRYVHHDIFSLNTDHRQQTTPIGPILNALDEMEEEDFARISICNERESRKKWLGTSSWALKKLSKGRVPKRPNASGKRISGFIGKGFISIANEIIHLLQDTLNAFNNVFSPNNKSFDDKTIQVKNELQDELQTLKASERTMKKANTSVWKSQIRVAVSSPKKFNRDNLGNALLSAQGELNEDNELKAKKIRGGINVTIKSRTFKTKSRKDEIIQELNTLELSKKSKVDVNPNLISCDELGRLIQLPTAELQRRYADALQVNKKVETDIPSIFVHKKSLDHVKIENIKISIGSNNITVDGERLKVRKGKENSILIGQSEKQGKINSIGLPVSNPDELFRSYVLMGEQGMGKDTALQNLVVEGSSKHNISFVVIDQVDEEGHRGMANGIRDSLPPEKIIDIDLSNEEYLPPLDLSEIMKKLGRKGADRFANELIDLMNIEDMGQSKKLLRDFAKAANGSKYQLKELLENERFRVKRIKELREQGNNRLADELDKYSSYTEYEDKFNSKGEKTGTKEKFIDGQSKLDSKASAIINRLDTFLGDDTLFNIFAQPPHEDFKLEQWIREGKVIIFRLPDRVLSTVAVKVLVHWITLITLMTRLLMKKEGQKNGTFIVYNECHTYMTKGLEDLMVRIATQGRKEKLGALFAIQQFNLLPDRLKENLTGGGVNWLLFRSGNESIYEKFEKLGKLKPAFEVESAMSIEKWHSIAILNFGGRPQSAFLVEMLAPSYKRYQIYNNSFLTQRHVRMYGRHFEEVEKLIS